MRKTQNIGLRILIGSSLFSAVLGSVHGFSVFLAPLEATFSASRGMVSLTYSLALVSLTIVVFFGHRIYSHASPPKLVALSSILAASGLLIAALAPSLAIVWLGYGVLFGAANGLGYGFVLQLSAQANPNREGFAMGIVTAAYALGAALSPPLFTAALALGGFQAPMVGLAIVVVGVGAFCAYLLSQTKVRYLHTAKRKAAPMPHMQFLFLWIGYGAGVAAGLMAIGHAAGIASVRAPGAALWAAPMTIALCNLAGSALAGRALDRISPFYLLAALPLFSVVALLLLGFSGTTITLLPCLGAVGFAYGGIIASYPAAIAKLYGPENSAQIYGRVFTAWGSAGLFAPWLAGYLFDRAGHYQTALLTAAVLGVVSTLAIAKYASKQTPP